MLERTRFHKERKSSVFFLILVTLATLWVALRPSAPPQELIATIIATTIIGLVGWWFVHRQAVDRPARSGLSPTTVGATLAVGQATIANSEPLEKRLAEWEKRRKPVCERPSGIIFSLERDMSFKDTLLKCSGCGTDFVFRVEQQRRMAAEGSIVAPQLCPACQGNGEQEGRFVGHVKWFDAVKGYGFIKRDDGRGEVFVHRNDIQHVGIKVLYEGERVQFHLEHDPRGEKAVNVTGHDPFAP